MPLYSFEELPNGLTRVIDRGSGLSGTFETNSGFQVSGDLKAKNLANLYEQEMMSEASLSKFPTALKLAAQKIAAARKEFPVTRLPILKQAVSKLLKGGLPSVALSRILPDIGEIVRAAEMDRLRKQGA